MEQKHETTYIFNYQSARSSPYVSHEIQTAKEVHVCPAVDTVMLVELFEKCLNVPIIFYTSVKSDRPKCI